MAEPEKLSPNDTGASFIRVLLLAALAVLLFSSGTFLPILGFWGLLMTPLPLALLGMRQGPRRQTVGTALAAGAVLLLFDPLSAFYFLVSQGPLSFALSLAPRRGRSGGESLLLCSMVSIASKLVLLGVFLALTGRNPLMPDPEQLRQIFSHLYDEVALEGDQLQALREAVEGMMALFPYMMPSLLLLSSALDAFLNYRLGEFFQRGRASAPPALPPFPEWRFSRTLLPAMFLAFFMELAITDWTAGAMFAMNLKLVLNVFFFVQGLSLLWWWLLRRRVGLLGRFAVLVLLVVPFVWLWLVFLGMGDMIFDLRRRGRGTDGLGRG